MIRKYLYMILLLWSLLTPLYSSEEETTSAIKGGVGIDFLFNIGYEAFLEYEYSKKTSFYLMSNLFQNVKQSNEGVEAKIGDIQMIGLQLRYYSYFLFGYHQITQHNLGKDVEKKANYAYSIGAVKPWKEWEVGATVYYLDATTINQEDTSIVSLFVRKKFSFDF